MGGAGKGPGIGWSRVSEVVPDFLKDGVVSIDENSSRAKGMGEGEGEGEGRVR